MKQISWNKKIWIILFYPQIIFLTLPQYIYEEDPDSQNDFFGIVIHEMSTPTRNKITTTTAGELQRWVEPESAVRVHVTLTNENYNCSKHFSHRGMLVTPTSFLSISVSTSSTPEVWHLWHNPFMEIQVQSVSISNIHLNFGSIQVNLFLIVIIVNNVNTEVISNKFQIWSRTSTVRIHTISPDVMRTAVLCSCLRESLS